MIKRLRKTLWSLVALLAWPAFVFAHQDEPHEEVVKKGIDEIVKGTSVKLVLIGSVIIALVVIFSLLKRTKSEGLKTFLFWAMVVPTVLITAFIAGSTVVLNINSVTKGPVHWHADYQIYNCGEPVDLIDPQGLLNRVGTPVLHEHGDDRLHVEGAVIELQDVSLESFVEVVGGRLDRGLLVVPTDGEPVVMRDGEQCFGGQPGRLQVFLYKTENDVVTQRKLQDYEHYVLSPETVVPPGDCVIFEFTPEIKERTEHICDFYQIEINKGNLNYVQ